MTNPLHAQYYADNATVERGVEIIETVQLARDTCRTRLACPALARRILPGQFVMVRLAHCDDPLIGRPLAMYDVWLRDGEPAGVDIVYLVKGKLTTRLANSAAAATPGTSGTGQRIDVWGPLGNGFDATRSAEHLIMVAGGIGQTPFVALAKQRLGKWSYGDGCDGAISGALSSTPRVTLCYGARSADLLAGVEDFEATGVDVRLSTDDGSAGRRGLVTEDLDALLAQCDGPGGPQRAATHVVCCGPEPMMEAVAKVTARHGVTCEVSLETPMACGIGICFSCVAKIKQPDGQWDYKRTCVDGPVFDAAHIHW